MTTLLDALAPELARLDVTAGSVNGDPERALAVTLQQASTDLGTYAVGLDAQGTDLRQALADLRTRIAALEPAPPLPPPLPKPVGFRSGLPWASGERHGNAFLGPLSDPATGLPAFETMRGRPVDLEMVFVDAWRTSTAASWPAACDWLKPASALPWLAARGTGVVLSIPLFPMLGLAVGKQRFADVMAGLYDGVHADLAARFAAYQGLHVIGLRVGWEANGGFPWGHLFCEGDYSLWRQAFARVSGIWKAAFPQALVALNFLRQWSVNAPTPFFRLDDLLQGDTDWFDVLGADCYTNQLKGDVRAYLSAGTPDRPQGAVAWAAAARDHGKMVEVSEWGAARTAFPADNPARDTPDFPRQMFDLFLSWPHLGWHEIVGAASVLPLTRAGYVSRWAPA
jgi:hypothetical protein